MKTQTWEVVVWDGMRWYRSEVLFDHEERARDAASRLVSLCPTFVARTEDIESHGLPRPPSDSHAR